MARKGLTGMGGLNRREALEFGLAHLHLLPALEAHSPDGTLDKVDSVAVEALVNAADTARRPGNGDPGALALHLVPQLLLVTLTEVLDDGRFHRKLDPVEREEPNDVPNPDDSDPPAGDTGDVRERPVGERGNDRRDELSNAESDEESIRGPLHKEEAVRTSNEDESLGDNSDLEVDDHVDDRVVDVFGLARSIAQRDSELVLKEGGLEDDDQKRNAAEHQ